MIDSCRQAKSLAPYGAPDRALGLLGVLIRRNIIFTLMSIEVMLNASGLAFIAAGARWGQPDGQVMFLFILAVAAGQAAEPASNPPTPPAVQKQAESKGAAKAARDEERDKERAWQMLNNMNLWVGGRGRGPGGQPGAPANQ